MRLNTKTGQILAAGTALLSLAGCVPEQKAGQSTEPTMRSGGYGGADSVVTTNIGRHGVSSDGTTSTRIGSTSFRSDGVTTTHIGSTAIRSNGTTGTSIGNMTIYSDGSTEYRF